MSAEQRRNPLRGEIWWTQFPTDPPDKGRRPVIVVSPDGRNCHPRVNTVMVIPLSTSVHRPGPSNLLLRSGETGLREDSIARAENICTVEKSDFYELARGSRNLSNQQICRLATLVRIAMGCVD